jgi:hypothetical protein
VIAVSSSDFGLKIGVEGEKEFKKALSDINQSFKVLGSEMTLVTSQFDKQDKSVQAAAARNEVLNKQIDAQKTKIETLRAALQNASDSFGENDRRTQNWQIQLNKAQAELNGMERELSESAEGADNLGNELKESGNEAEKSGSKFEKLGGVLKGVGVAMGAVVVAAGAAAVKLGKEVVAPPTRTTNSWWAAWTRCSKIPARLSRAMPPMPSKPPACPPTNTWRRSPAFRPA